MSAFDDKYHRGGLWIMPSDSNVFYLVQLLCVDARCEFRRQWDVLQRSLALRDPVLDMSVKLLLTVFFCVLGAVVILGTMFIQYINATVAAMVSGRILVP